MPFPRDISLKVNVIPQLCNNRNHFTLKCPKKVLTDQKTVNRVLSDSYSDTQSVLCMCSEREKSRKTICAYMTVNERKVKFQVDSNATVNIMPQKYVQQFKLQRLTKKILMWNRTKFTAISKYCFTLRYPKNKQTWLSLLQ